MKTTSFKMSDEMALGFFDADGSILMDVEKKTNGKKYCVFSVDYFVGQSPSKADATSKFAEKFGGETSPRRGDFKYNQSSEVGNRVRTFLSKNEPKNPYRVRDFYISEALIGLLNKQTQSSKIGQVTLARLVSNKSILREQKQSKIAFAAWCEHIGATDSEISQGLSIADPIVAEIETKVEQQTESLLTTSLSNDYVLGAHFGDGSLYVALSWKPTKTNHRLRCEPEWAISGNNEVYCQAFVRTFGGTTKDVDKKGQRKFVLSGIQQCFGILYLFTNAPWMPAYKAEQFTRWRDSINLLVAQEHFTEQGIRRLLDLSYGLAEKGGRKYTKEEYLAWGSAWLNNPARQRRTPRRRPLP
uniref:LAGLIDADG homing endonuclease n=1 Tax=Chlamydomonas komma TaxID=28459 RepID=Q8WKZ9_9CHLO|nr:putative protein [Chlamydomonas komma]